MLDRRVVFAILGHGLGSQNRLRQLPFFVRSLFHRAFKLAPSPLTVLPYIFQEAQEGFDRHAEAGDGHEFAQFLNRRSPKSSGLASSLQIV